MSPSSRRREDGLRGSCDLISSYGACANGWANLGVQLNERTHADAVRVRDHDAIVSELNRIAAGLENNQSALHAMSKPVDTHLDGRRRFFF